MNCARQNKVGTTSPAACLDIVPQWPLVEGLRFHSTFHSHQFETEYSVFTNHCWRSPQRFGYRLIAYDTLTQRDGNWPIEAAVITKDEAISIGTQMLGRPGVTGIKVIRETDRSIAQLKDSDVIFEKFKAPKN